MDHELRHNDTAKCRRFNRTVAVITVSDRSARGERKDESGDKLCNLLASRGYEVVCREVVPDEVPLIAAMLRHCCDVRKVALVLTTGGTGVSPRDVTPEATRAVVQREVPGMSEAMRSASAAKTPHAMISRAVVGVRQQTLIVNLPGSPRGAIENFEVLWPALDHALEKIQGDPRDCGSP